MPDGTPAREDELLRKTRQIVERWGVELPDAPKDFQLAIKIALRDAASVAGKAPFGTQYPDDHGWSSTGMRGLTTARLQEDDKPTGLGSAGEEWGVAALLHAFESCILVPLVLDVDQDFARELVHIIDDDMASWLDVGEALQVLGHGAEDKPDEDLKVSIVAASWMELRDLSKQHSCLPLSEAVHFRLPVVWDLLRARLSGADIPALPEFDEVEFSRRRLLSARHDRREIESAQSMLEAIKSRDCDLTSAAGLDWFAVMGNCLNVIGKPRAFEGLSVLLHFNVLERAPGQNPHLPVEFAKHESYGQRNICIGYGLDPVQAGYLEDLARREPELFCDFNDEATGLRFEAIATSVIPDMHISMSRATISGRDAEAYDRLRSATIKDKVA